METVYQRSRIQEESLTYEHAKASGDLPLIGVNTFLGDDELATPQNVELSRSTDAQKQSQVDQVAAIETRFGERGEVALQKLREAALSGENLFTQLMETSKYCSLGRITRVLYEVGGTYRRNT